MVKKTNTVTKLQFIENNGLQILTALIAVIVFIVFYDFIFFNKLYLFKGLASDSINDTYPNYILISDYLRTDGLPKWSFSQGMGQSIFPFSFPDPFVSLLYLLKRENLAYGIAYMEILKIFLAGIFFYLYLKKICFSSYVCIIGSLLYSFSSFMIIGSCWNMFSTEVVYLALLLLSIEKIFQNDNWLLLPLTIALIGVLQPFDVWLFGVFTLLYIIFRYYSQPQLSEKKLFFVFTKVGLLAVLGIGIGSFFFLSEFRMMLNSPRGGGAAGYYDQLLSKSIWGFESELHYITVIMRLFSSELLGHSNTYKGWYNFMEAPLFYCGLINLLLFPQLFQFLDNRKKWIYGIWGTIIILPVVFPFLRYSLWLFTGNYYRVYSFFVSFIIMFFSIQALYNIINSARVNRKLLLISLGALLILLYYPYDYLNQYKILNTDIRKGVTLLLIVYSILLYFLHNQKKSIYILVILLVVIFIELTVFSKNNINERRALTKTEHKQKKGYFDYTNDAISYLNKIDKSFFRASKNYFSGPSIHTSLNDAKIQRYRGTGSYHSFNQKYYVRFLSSLNVIDDTDEEQTRWLIGLRNEPMLHSHASVKYFFSKLPNLIRHPSYDSLATFNDVIVYKNKYSLPLGFTYNKMITKKEFETYSKDQKIKILYKASIVNDSIYGKEVEGFPLFHFNDTAKVYTHEEYVNDINSLKSDTLQINHFSNNTINGIIKLTQRKMLLISIPYSNGWTALVDGKKTSPIRVNIGFIGLLLDPGEHSINLSFTPPLYNIGGIISIISILIYVLLIFVNKKNMLR